MTPTAEQLLSQFHEPDYTVRVCRAVFSVIPSAPPFVLYDGLDGAVQRVQPGAGPDVLAATRTRAQSAEAARALWVADALDTADAGLAAFTGMRNVLSFFSSRRGAGSRTFEADKPQALDAAVKLTALGYMASKLFTGSPMERAQRLLALPAGREAALYYATAEVALPFADNLVEAGGSLLGRLMRHTSSEGAARFAQFAGQDSLQEASGLLAHLMPQMEGLLGEVHTHLASVTESVKGHLPTALNVADSLTGALATGLDALPVWRFLGGRLVAEASVAA